MNFRKITRYSLPGALRSSFSGEAFSARKAWLWFLLGVFILICANAAAGVYFFEFFGRQPSYLAEVGDLRGPKPDLEGLKKVIGALGERESDFNKLLEEPLSRDPSL